jgi:hypothetical protein
VQCTGSVAKETGTAERCVPAVAPIGPLHPVTVPGPAVSVLPVREGRYAGYTCTYPEAQAQDVAQPFVLHVGMATDWTTTFSNLECGHING